MAVWLATLAALALSLATPSAHAQGPPEPPSARLGHIIYQENCAACHGAQGLGDGPTSAQLSSPAAALADSELARQVTLAQWFEVVKEGRMERFMPPWKNRLTDEEIWDVVAFSYALHTTEETISQGEAIWAGQCAACHGDLGAGDGPQALASGWQMANLSDPTYAANRSLEQWREITSAGQGDMPAFADQLSTEEIWAALEYARTFTYRPLFLMNLPPGQGRIVGQVSNGASGGAIDNLTVTLRSFQNFEELRTRTAELTEDGRFLFENTPTGPEYAYLVTADYGGVSFSSGVGSFASDVTELALPLTVWEGSATPGEISVELAQWFVEYREGALLVGELYRINHASERVYLGSEEIAPGRTAVLRFDLPAGAASLSLDGGEIGDRFILSGNSVIDTQPLQPGPSQVLMRYLIPYNGTRAELAHSIPYPVREMSVLVGSGPTLRVDNLQETGVEVIDQRQFVNYQASNLPAERMIRLRFSGLARGANAAGGSQAVLSHSPGLVYGLGGLAGGIMLGLLAIALVGWRQQRGQPLTTGRPPAAAEAQNKLLAERQRLLRSIAQLDDRFEAGELDRETHQSLRKAQKRSLVLVTHQLEKAGGQDSAAARQPRRS